MEKWSIDKLHAVEKPHEQRSYTACYHGADSDALAIYKYANTTAFRLHWSRIYTPTKVSASLTTTVFLFYLFISPTLCVCARSRACVHPFPVATSWSQWQRAGYGSQHRLQRSGSYTLCPRCGTISKHCVVGQASASATGLFGLSLHGRSCWVIHPSQQTPDTYQIL